MIDNVTLLPIIRVDREDEDTRMPEREIIARTLYLRHHGTNPDFQIGVDKLGYHQEPYVKKVPGWEWFHGADADAIIAALEQS